MRSMAANGKPLDIGAVVSGRGHGLHGKEGWAGVWVGGHLAQHTPDANSVMVAGARVVDGGRSKGGVLRVREGSGGD